MLCDEPAVPSAAKTPCLTPGRMCLVILKPNGRPPDVLEQAMREKLQTVAGATALFTTPLGMRIDEGLGGTPADISVRIFGSDLDRLASLGDRAQELMRGIKRDRRLAGRKADRYAAAKGQH